MLFCSTAGGPQGAAGCSAQRAGFLYNSYMVQLNRPHIGIFGKMNAGKSSLLNTLTGQDTSVVSSQAGTTTDPVKKIIELLDIGPVTLVDTAGVDDASLLGQERVKRTLDSLEQVDLAVLVFAGELDSYDQQLMADFAAHNIPFFLVHNKSDVQTLQTEIKGADVLEFSCKKPDLPALLSLIKKHLPASSNAPSGVLDGYVRAGDEVALVIPVDASAPAGRLILPQVQTIRNLLDIGAVAVCVKDTELEVYLKTHTPALVVTDSQAFKFVSSVVPPQIPLTSFSILFSRQKGDFEAFLAGTQAIDALREGDKVLIMESCSHTVNKCDDIGRTKIPAWLQKYTGKKLEFTVLAHLDALPENLSQYKLAVQCGGCMVTRTQILRRLEKLKAAGVAVSNYGMTISFCHGIFNRATEIFRRK